MLIDAMNEAPSDSLRSSMIEPNALFNHLTATEDEILRVSIANRKKLYKHHACTNFIKSGLHITNCLALNLRARHVRLENIATKFFIAPVNNRYKRDRRAAEIHPNLQRLLESAQLIKTCTRFGFHKEATAIMDLTKRWKHPVQKGGALNWLVADAVLIMSEAALTLRTSKLRALHEHVPLSKVIGNMHWLRLVDTHILHQNNHHLAPACVQWTLHQECYTLSAAAAHAPKLYRTSTPPGDRLKSTP